MSARSSVLGIAVVAALSLSACDATSSSGDKAAEPASPAAPTQTPPLTASGAPVTLTAEQGSQSDDGLQWAAGVVRVDQIPGESAKLFGVAGGDPAMNGLQTHIAFFDNPATGWIIYEIGDFLDYTVLSHANGRVDLDIHESTYDEASGNIGDRHRKIIVQWTQGANDVVPTAVTVTPAQ